MAGFQDNLTEQTAPAQGSVAPASAVPSVPSTGQVVASGLASIFDIGVKAAPLIQEYATNRDVDKYSKEFRDLTIAKEQGMSDNTYNTRRRELELRATQNLDTAGQQLLKNQIGLSQFSIDSQGAAQAAENLKVQKMGESLGYSGAEAMLQGRKSFNLIAEAQQKTAEYQAIAEKRKLSTAEDEFQGFSIYSAIANNMNAGLAKNVVLPVITGAISATSAEGQKQLTGLATDMVNLAQANSIRITEQLRAEGRSPAFIAGAVKAVTGEVNSIAGFLTSTVKTQQDAATSYLKALQSDFGTKLAERGGTFGRMIASDPSGRTMTVFLDKMMATDKPAFDKLVKEFTDSFKDTGNNPITDAPADPLDTVRKAFKMSTDGALIKNEKNPEKAYQLSDVAHGVVTSFQKDGVVKPEDSKAYASNYLNLMQGVVNSKVTARQSTWMYTAQTESHRKYMASLPTDEKAAISKATGDAAVYTARQAISSIGIPGLITYDTQSQQFVLDSNIVEQKRIEAQQASGVMIAGITQVFGQSSAASYDEAKKGAEAVKVLNQMSSILQDNAQYQPVLGQFNKAQVGFIFADTLKSTGSSALGIKGKVDFPSMSSSEGMQSITPADLLQRAQDTIKNATDKVIGIPTKPRKGSYVPFQGGAN
jgi:hypothetical protein